MSKKRKILSRNKIKKNTWIVNTIIDRKIATKCCMCFNDENHSFSCQKKFTHFLLYESEILCIAYCFFNNI
jgi:hypothetical protein